MYSLPMDTPGARPLLSVVVIFFNMRREAPRTLFSLTSAYQRGIDPADYEVIAIDNGSTEPLSRAEVEACGANVRYVYHDTSSVSPVGAVNLGVDLARADHVVVCIDGARILSPGILSYSAMALRAFRSPFVYTIGLHLGQEVQNLSMKKGYSQAVEDQLLDSVDWRHDGYALFSISTLALSSRGGWLSPISESNCFAIAKEEFHRLGGFHTGFQSPGGGLVNLDFFSLACQAPHLVPVVLMGEGTFHQFHGGVATNVPLEAHPFPQFSDEYVGIRAKLFEPPTFTPQLLGHLPPNARRFLDPLGAHAVAGSVSAKV